MPTSIFIESLTKRNILVKNGREDLIFHVGSSSKNTHKFISISIKEKIIGNNKHFYFYLDGILKKESVWECKNNRATIHIIDINHV
jgi:hypothetical protein